MSAFRRGVCALVFSALLATFPAAAQPAKAVGLAVAQSILLRADRVIE